MNPRRPSRPRLLKHVSQQPSGPDPWELLGQATGVALDSLHRAALADPGTPTPCTRWNLATLVRHLTDSTAATRELLTGLPPGPPPQPGCAPARHELQLLRATVLDLPRDPDRMHWAALPASYELTLHAWDINQATGCRKPLPPTLVEALLARAPLVVDGVDRTDLFAAPLPPPRPGLPTDRLLALFGRRALPAV
ncbi:MULTISPECIES: hypothetical protein [Streptomyces]|uniref:Mycothiol-dependent maleylpyruvate isomerase metal-binding domain-containing protein n=1 Tax=Streptomyces flaveolus TaxID=67297 RepID=A0ABV3ANS4_9ACTN|nr:MULTISPECIES: hypothetical protein [Streptomyces]